MRDNHNYTFKYILSMSLNRHDNYYTEEKGFEERHNVIGLLKKNKKHYTSYWFHFINLN